MRKWTCASLLLLSLLLLGCARQSAEFRAETGRESRFAASGSSDRAESRKAVETHMKADSVIVYQTDTLTVAKYYAVHKTKAQTDTLFLLRSDTLTLRDTVSISVKAEIEKEAKGGFAAVPMHAWAMLWIIALAAAVICMRRKR